MGQTLIYVTTANTQSLHVECDLDPQACISSSYNYQLCQIILESHHAGQSYGTEASLHVIQAFVHSSSSHAPCDLELQANDMVLASNICLVMMIFYAKYMQFEIPP